MKVLKDSKTITGLTVFLLVFLLVAGCLVFLLREKNKTFSPNDRVVVAETQLVHSSALNGGARVATTNSNGVVVGTSAAPAGKPSQPLQILPDDDGQISASAMKQIAALQKAKAGRTPAQDKLDSQLIYAAKMQKREPIAEGVSVQLVDLDRDSIGRILVDISAEVTDGLLLRIRDLGGNVINSFAHFHAIRAGLPVDAIEMVATRTEVKFIAPAARAICNTGSVNSQGDYAHGAASARLTYGVDGSGVKVGVLSDSVDYLANSQTLGDLPADLTTLPGQSGVPNSGEGTAMLEIVHDLAPGSKLYFATAFISPASFAQNILNLRSNGCDIIVDDVYYFNESPFQDALIAQAVNSVTADGALYFSSAGNSGSVDRGTAGTWEGDFVDGGATASPLEAGRIHSFTPGINYDTVGSGGTSLRVDLFWADPLGASTNDYDVYVLNSTGTSVVSSSTSRQNGSQDPYESISTLASGNRIVIVKYSGAGRFLHLETGRGRLVINTPGNTKGHACATNSFCVAAVDSANAGGGANAFAGGAQDPVETFSSDGPRRVFFQADGTAITPGDYSSAGGSVRQKPDITAADGVATTLPSGSGLNPFYGTSAAAPHAGAVAALLKSYNPILSPAQLRNILTNTALDIMAAGVDQDSGSGIVMVPAALLAAPPDALRVSLGDPSMAGVVGGPFDPSSQNINLTNTSSGALNWSLINTSSWLNATPASGTLLVGAQTNVSISPEVAANSLAVGTYSTVVQFSNQTTHVVQSRTVTIQVLPVWMVSPTNGFAASGVVGGPFNMTSQNYALTNLGAATLNWGVANTSAWLTVSSPGGTLASGANSALTISLGAAANTLTAGNYTNTVVVTNSVGINLNLNFTLQVRQSLVQNGDFETGSFTGWTQSGNTAYTTVISNSANYVHAGTYGARFGPTATLGYISQTLATSPGQSYLVSFWLANPTVGTPNQFVANWNGSALYNQSNLGSFAWTNLTFVITATNTNSTLQFGFRNDPYYFGLDDITVTYIPVPFVNVFSKKTNTFSLAWNTLPGVVYQVQYQTNLINTNWFVLSNITAAASTTTFTNATGSDQQRYYRIRRLP